MQKLSDYAHMILRGFLVIAMAALMVMMMAIVSDVFMRFMFNSPITGAYDVVEICLVIAIFYSLGSAIIGAHEIVIDIIDQIASTVIVSLLRRMAALLSAAVLVFIFISMLTPAYQSYQYGEMRLELNMPVWIVWVIALAGMSGGVLASIICLFGNATRGGTVTSEQRDSA